MNNNDTLGTQNCKLSQADPFFDPHITIFGDCLYVYKTKNRLMVSNHSQRVTEILAIYRMTKFDFPPNFLKGLIIIIQSLFEMQKGQSYDMHERTRINFR